MEVPSIYTKSQQITANVRIRMCYGVVGVVGVVHGGVWLQMKKTNANFNLFRL